MASHTKSRFSRALGLRFSCGFRNLQILPPFTFTPAVFFAWYNFCRKHESIKTTPAVASRIANKQLTIRELVELAA